MYTEKPNKSPNHKMQNCRTTARLETVVDLLMLQMDDSGAVCKPTTVTGL